MSGFNPANGGDGKPHATTKPRRGRGFRERSTTPKPRRERNAGKQRGKARRRKNYAGPFEKEPGASRKKTPARLTRDAAPASYGKEAAWPKMCPMDEIGTPSLVLPAMLPVGRAVGDDALPSTFGGGTPCVDGFIVLPPHRLCIP